VSALLTRAGSLAPAGSSLLAGARLRPSGVPRL